MPKSPEETKRDILNTINKECATRLHMFDIGVRTQTSALFYLHTQAATIAESIDILHRHAHVGQLTDLSHGLVVDQLIHESAQIIGQLLAIKANMERE